MAIKLTDRIQANTAEGIIADGSQVFGAFITVNDKATIKATLLEDGLTVFDTIDRKYYRYEGTEEQWVEVESESNIKKTVTGYSPVKLTNVNSKEHDIEVKVDTRRDIITVEPTIELQEYTPSIDIGIYDELKDFSQIKVTFDVENINNVDYSGRCLIYAYTAGNDIASQVITKDTNHVDIVFDPNSFIPDREPYLSIPCSINFAFDEGKIPTEDSVFIKNMRVTVDNDLSSLTVSNGESTYNFSSDGIAQVKSISPETTLTLNKNDVEFSATYNEAFINGLQGLVDGEGKNSVVQVQGGAYNSRGQAFSQSRANGVNAVSLGANNTVDGTNGFATGHDNEVYQYDSATVGAANIVGNKKYQRIFDGLMTIANTEGYHTTEEAVSWLKTEAGWEVAKNTWNENLLYAEALATELGISPAECKINYSSFDSAQQALKYSFGFAGGTSNTILGRAAAGFGTHNTISGQNSFGSGQWNECGASSSLFGGEYNYIGAGKSLVVGDHLYTTGGPKAVFGQFNENKGNWSLLEVGFGTSDSDRKNAIEVKKNGSLYVATQDVYDNAAVLYKTLKDYALPKTAKPSDWSAAIYANNGSDTVLKATSGADAYSIVMRSSTGCTEFNEPQKGSHAATKNYVDNTVQTEIKKLVDSAPEALNTLGELAEALNNHEDAYDALLETVGNKVDKSELDNYTKNDYFEEAITDINQQIKDKPYAELKQLGSYVSKSNSINTIDHIKENDVGRTYTTLYQISNICPTIEELIGKTFTISGIFDEYRPTETISFVLTESDYHSYEGVTRIRGYILLVASEAVIYGDIELQPGLYLETSTFVYDGRHDIREITDLQVEGYNFTTYTELDKYYITTLCNSIKNGEGQSSIVQKQTGLFNDAGQLYRQSTANGAGSVAFGSANEVHAGNGLTAGHSNDLWQYNAFAFGGGHTVGDQVKHNRYHAILDMSVGETFEEKITYLKENWDAVKEEYNHQHPEDIIQTSSFANFQHLNKISFGFAAGTSNIVTGRSAIALGGYLDASTEYKVALGSFNLDKGATTVLEVGYGTGREDRRNAFEVMKDGSATVATQGTSDNSVVINSTIKNFATKDALNNYLPIVNYESTEYSHRIYGVNSKGVQTMHPATNGSSANTIARRDAKGGCQFEDPTYAKDAVNKRTLDSAIANLLVADKSTSDFSYRTYVIRSTGQQQVMRATSGKSENTFVMRDANGCSQFNTPVGANDAATKAYVDSALKDIDLSNYVTKDYLDEKLTQIENVVDRILEIQNSLIGGKQ